MTFTIDPFWLFILIAVSMLSMPIVLLVCLLNYASKKNRNANAANNIISEIGQSRTHKELDAIEQKAIQYYLKEMPNNVKENITMIVLHFKKRRLLLSGNDIDALEVQNEIDVRLKKP